MDLIVIGSAFLLGLGSSLHCLGMCGPLVMAVPFPRDKQNFLSKLVYFIGKAFAYGFLGALIGFFGIKAIWGEIQQYLSIISGVLIILMALFPFIIPKNSKYPFQKIFQKTFQQIKNQPKWWHFLQLGMLNGFLPCGMVYMALTVAFASGSSFNGFLAMLAFGIGTTPILWAVTLVRDKITASLRQKLKPITLVIAFLIGGLLILRGLNLGIPYISPKMNHQVEQKMHCH